MDAKDLRTEAALGDRSNDGNTKYAQGGGAVQCHRNKTYQDIGSNSLGKVDVTCARPCAVIGPDRVVPPPAAADAYHKKGPSEPWMATDNTYRRPPEYPHKLLDYQHPTRNISPRQTFQENMQRIMVAPTYSSVKTKEDHNFPGDPNISQMRINKLNVSSDSNPKYCDVPYNINSITIEQKHARNSDTSAANMNPVLTRSAPHVWPPAGANLRPLKPYPQELYQYPEYPSCAGPRPMLVPRPHRNLLEEPGPVYPDGYYHDGNIRFKPYPTSKERYPQSRYEYIGNYTNPFNPSPFQTHKYDLQKPMPPHPYPGHPPVPLKYLDGRIVEPVINGYQRPVNQPNYNNMPYRNQVIHANYGPIPNNCLQANKFYPYPPDNAKSMPSNKLPYDANSKFYTEFENNRMKGFHLPEGFYVNEMGRPHPIKGQVMPPNYPASMHAMPHHPYYRKENVPIRGYEYSTHLRNVDPSLNINANPLSRLPSQFSPTAVAISPSDSSASNDTNQNHIASQEDCGYVSQSSTASARSIDSCINRFPPDIYRRYDPKYSPLVKSLPKHEVNSQSNSSSKHKKDIDVRQFLQMWNEGEDDNGENNTRDAVKTAPNSTNNNHFDNSTQEQLYVLGLVNVPSEELSKYEHIQKVSKLPENIKGYNSIELLHQFEEVIESSNLNNFNSKLTTTRDFHTPLKGAISMHGLSIPSRPLSPLDVEAKISQSVIHKEVGCNFEIKPCSPKMLNVEVATSVQSVFTERVIEKVSNPLIIQSPSLQDVNESRDDCSNMKYRDRVSENPKVTSCKMVNTQYNGNNPVDSIKTNYSLQDLESNSGVCLASLPRLDNDIELSFPEVNQQFINANKVESDVTTLPCKDLPTLDMDQSDITDRNLLVTETSISISNIEKDLSKLSKYRKFKRKSYPKAPNPSEVSVQALRTDSVIIKNPDNVKTKSEEAQRDPINLSLAPSHLHDEIEQSDFIANESTDNDSAIDFSLNSIDQCVNKNENTTLLRTSWEEGKHDMSNNNLLGNQTILHGDSNSMSCKDHNDSKFDEASMLYAKKDVNKQFEKYTSETDVLNTPNDSVLSNEDTLHENYESSSKKHGNTELEETKSTYFKKDDDRQLAENFTSDINLFDMNSKNLLDNQENLYEELRSSPHSNLEIDRATATVLEESADKEVVKNLKSDIICSGGLDDTRSSTQSVFQNTTSSLLNEVTGSEESIKLDMIQETANDAINENDVNSLFHSLAEKEDNEKDNNNMESSNYANELDISSCSSDSELEGDEIGISRDNCTEIETMLNNVFEHCDKDTKKIELKSENTPEKQEQYEIGTLETEVTTKAVSITETRLKKNQGTEFETLVKADKQETQLDNLCALHPIQEQIKAHTQVKVVSFLKELLSPWIQKLCVHTEGNVEENFNSRNCTTSLETNLERNKTATVVDNSMFVNENTPSSVIQEPITDSLSEIEGCLQPEVIDCEDQRDSIYQKGSVCDNDSTDDLCTSQDVCKSKNAEEPIAIEKTKLVDTQLKSPENVEKLHMSTSNNINVDESESTLCDNNTISEKKILLTSKSPEVVESELDEKFNHADLVISEKDNCGSLMPVNDNTELNCDVSQEFEKKNTVKENYDRVRDYYKSKDETDPILTELLPETDCHVGIDKNIVSLLNTGISVDIFYANSSDRTTHVKKLNIHDAIKSPTKHADNVDEFDQHDNLKTVCSNLNSISDNDTEGLEICQKHEAVSVQNLKDKIGNESKVLIDSVDLQKDITVMNSTVVAIDSIQEKNEMNTIIEAKIDKTQSKDPMLLGNVCTNISKKRIPLKRSYSDSALDNIRENPKEDNESDTLLRINKRRKFVEPHDFLHESYCNILQNQRRNSISSIQNGENVSLCILIDDDCIITGEDEEADNICFTEVAEDCIACVQDPVNDEEEPVTEIISFQDGDVEYSQSDDNFLEETLDGPWVEDVACVETVVTDDIAENIVISASTSPRSNDLSDGESQDDTEPYNFNEHTDKLKYIYGDKMCRDDSHFMDTLYRTPQMNVDRTLNPRESQIPEDNCGYYDKESLEKVLSESNVNDGTSSNSLDYEYVPSPLLPTEKENLKLLNVDTYTLDLDKNEETDNNTLQIFQGNVKNAISVCESSIDEVLICNKNGDSPKYILSSSPEVSSTTSEERNSGLFFNISNYSESIVPEVDDVIPGSRISCKYTEKKDYLSSNNNLPTRTLLTKAAQKYIPPIKETIPDLKVKLRLPQHSLTKLKQLKITKETVKPNHIKTNSNNYLRKEIPKKSKPKFEDVLMSIDEMQFQKQKEKSREKKIRKSIPKVVIKKNENGSHYASTSKTDKFNPDLTGRKWQPWVFLEKNSFIDKMALKRKTRAIFSHRKNTYVLAEKFQKYRSIGNTKFIISQPRLSDSSPGQLKYTIKLKHDY